MFISLATIHFFSMTLIFKHILIFDRLSSSITHSSEEFYNIVYAFFSSYEHQDDLIKFLRHWHFGRGGRRNIVEIVGEYRQQLHVNNVDSSCVRKWYFSIHVFVLAPQLS